jgi:serine/threonine protein kinase
MVTSSHKQNDALSQFLSTVSLFENLKPQALAQVARSLTKSTYRDGEYIITEGELGEKFYILYEGCVVCTKNIEGGKQKELIRLNKGAIFGERAMIKKEPRGANVISVGEIECLSLGKKDFSLILEDIVDNLLKLGDFRILRSAPVLVSISDARLKRLMKSMDTLTLFFGSKIPCDPESIMFVIDGCLESIGGQVHKPGAVIGTVEKGSGKSGFLTCKAEESRIRTIKTSLLREATDSLDEDEEEEADDYSKRSEKFPPTFSKVKAMKKSLLFTQYESSTLDDLKIIKALGSGTFGSVFLASHSYTEANIALKVLDKAELAKNSQTQYVTREARTLMSLDHPFIAEYLGLLMSHRKIFFMLEYIPGGEFWSLLYGEERKKLPYGPCGGLTTELSTLYLANVIEALDHIHCQGFAYRDLKPENLLIAANGYLKLIDFGFSKSIPFKNSAGELQYRTYTLCGTPDYIAPEVILTHGHDKGVDYWSLGIMLYEFICGSTPFQALLQSKTFEKIVHAHKYLRFPRSFDSHAKSLVRRLLNPNASLRLGNLRGGAEDVKQHALFDIAKFNWNELREQKIEFAYKPCDNIITPQVELIDLQHEASVKDGASYDHEFQTLRDLGTTDFE